MPKEMSEKQLAANHANAQKSTGPKTAEGRAVSKMNALKHGIFSKEVLAHGLNFKENSRELAALYARFWETYQPVGPAEEMLVDQIVTAHWRLRRVLRAESGEITLSVDGGHWARSRSDPKLPVMLWHLAGDPVHAMQDSVLGNSIVAHWLRDLREHVEKEGELTEASLKRFRYDGKSNSLWAKLEKLRLQLSQNASGGDEAIRREENRKQALAQIDRELTMLYWEQAQCKKREEAEEEARQAAAVLPGPEVLEKIMRYETALQRQLFRAMSQLERLQRMRQGEAVPAPMTLEVSERH